MKSCSIEVSGIFFPIDFNGARMSPRVGKGDSEESRRSRETWMRTEDGIDLSGSLTLGPSEERRAILEASQ